MSPRSLSPVALALVATVLVACTSSEGDNDTPSATSESEPSAPGTYGDVDDLVEAVADAGWTCDVPVETPVSGDTETVRYCSPVEDPEALTFEIFSSDGDLANGVEEAEDSAEFSISEGWAPSSILVGANWLIGGPLEVLERIEPEMGGELTDLTGDYVEPACETPTGEALSTVLQFNADFALARAAHLVDRGPAAYNTATETLGAAANGVDALCLSVPEWDLFFANYESLGYRVHLGSAEDAEFVEVQALFDDWREAIGMERSGL